MQPQLPGTAESHLLGSPRALPLYPIARTFSSRWSVTTVPTCRRTHVERLASSSAMRMYTSYSGIRSTGTDGSAASRWSLLAPLMQLLVGIEVHVFAARPLLREPGIEAGGNQTVGPLLLVGGADRERVGILVLDVLVVAADPAPLHCVCGIDLIELLPQLGVLERARFTPPAPSLPVFAPLAHPLHQILGVGDEVDQRVVPLAADPFQCGDRARERHLVVRRLRRAFVEIPPRYAVSRRRFDQRGVASPARLRGIVAEAAFIRMHEHERRGHGWMTTGMSVCSRISSACETFTSMWRPDPTWAPANRASHWVRSITRATAAPGVPGSRCVTNATPCSDNIASASPITIVPIEGSTVA